ncbi:MAG TPA: hypothetical protein VGO46_06730 [Gemmatimonadaceae bacterium]|nr:hypothetical protein [Gemmatimonadaceae bacterium]
MAAPVRLKTRRPRWFWLALAMFALAQFDIVAIVPFADANEGRSAPAHVEAYGTTSHYAHDESNCAVCVARQLIGRTQLSVRMPLPAEHPVGVMASVELPAISLDRFSVTSPRAPPLQREL